MKKLLLIIPAMALILLNSCGNKGGITPLTAEDVTITVFGAGQDTTFTVPYEKAVEYERKYHACNNDSVWLHAKRHKAVSDSITITYTQGGKQILLVDSLDKLGLAVVRKGDLNNISVTDKSKKNTETVRPVVTPEPETPRKKGRGVFDSDTDFSWIGDLLTILFWLLIAAILIIGGYKLLRYLGAIPVGNNGGGSGGGTQTTGKGNNFSDHQQPIVERRSGSAKYTAGAGVKKTVIEEKRTITHYYDDNRS